MDPKGQKCNEDEWIAIRVEDPPSHQSHWRVGQQQAPPSGTGQRGCCESLAFHDCNKCFPLFSQPLVLRPLMTHDAF